MLYNVPTACNRATADFLVSSHLLAEPYERELIDFAARLRPRGDAARPGRPRRRAPGRPESG